MSILMLVALFIKRYDSKLIETVITMLIKFLVAYEQRASLRFGRLSQLNTRKITNDH